MKCSVWSVALYAAETWTLTQTDRRRLEAFEMWIWRRMEKISWLDKITNTEVLRRVNEDRKFWILLGKGNIDGLDMFWDTTDFCMKLLKAEWEINQQEGEKNSTATWFDKWWWLRCTQLGSWGQRGMETQRKDVKTCCTSEDNWWW